MVEDQKSLNEKLETENRFDADQESQASQHQPEEEQALQQNRFDSQAGQHQPEEEITQQAATLIGEYK